jgi:hypothetical protein
MFTLVQVTSDANNFVALLPFSKKGLRAWTNGKYAVLHQFRSITDEIVEKADSSAAFSLYDTAGQLLGGCVRRRSEREATCKAR